jgi:hypothetical protein
MVEFVLLLVTCEQSRNSHVTCGQSRRLCYVACGVKITNICLCYLRTDRHNETDSLPSKLLFILTLLTLRHGESCRIYVYFASHFIAFTNVRSLSFMSCNASESCVQRVHADVPPVQCRSLGKRDPYISWNVALYGKLHSWHI